MWNVPRYRYVGDDPFSRVPVRSTRREIQVGMQGINMSLERLGNCRSRLVTMEITGARRKPAINFNLR